MKDHVQMTLQPFVTIIILTITTVLIIFSNDTVCAKPPVTIHEVATTVATTRVHSHMKGVKLLNIHTKPSSVAVGNTLSIRGTVFNNSSATITFTNGTCTPPLSIDFNKNVMIENQGIAFCETLPQQVILKPGEKSSILSPNLSGIAYKAIAPGTTNATISLNYRVETPTSKSQINNSISRLYTFNIQSSPVLAVKKSNTGIHANPSTIVATTRVHSHMKGVKLLNIHTKPSSVAVGNTLSIRGTVFNNSSATITFTNGTCTPPLSIDFNKNVMIENQGIAFCETLPQQVILKPGEKSSILSPNLSGIAYKAIAPGTTNATISLNYRVETPTSKSQINNSISRLYTFNIQSSPVLAVKKSNTGIHANPSTIVATTRVFPPSPPLLK